jgi:hypothetical protein
MFTGLGLAPLVLIFAVAAAAVWVAGTQLSNFDRFSDALKEIIDARAWGGIHFRTADMQGAVLGKKVAHYLQKHYFQPTGRGETFRWWGSSPGGDPTTGAAGAR